MPRGILSVLLTWVFFLFVSYTLIAISSLNWGNFLLWFRWKYFLCLWSGYFLSSISIIVRYSPFVVSQISWMFLTQVSVSSIMFSRPEVLSSISCILLRRLVSVLPVQFLNFSFWALSQFWFSLLILFLLSGFEQLFCFLPLFVFSWISLRDLFFSSSRTSNHMHKGCFKVFFLGFSHVGTLRAC